MAVPVDLVELEKDNIVAGTPIDCRLQCYDVAWVQLFYGTVSRLEAVYSTDFNVELDADFAGFTLTPTASLISKIEALDEGNVVYVVRKPPAVTDFVPTDGFLRNKISFEVDHLWMAMQYARWAGANGENGTDEIATTVSRTFADLATAGSANITLSARVVYVESYSLALGRYGGARYKRVTDEPAHELKFYSNGWFEIDELIVDAAMAGAVPYTDIQARAAVSDASLIDSKAAFNRVLAYSQETRHLVTIVGDIYRVSNPLDAIVSPCAIAGVGGSWQCRLKLDTNFGSVPLAEVAPDPLGATVFSIVDIDNQSAKWSVNLAGTANGNDHMNQRVPADLAPGFSIEGISIYGNRDSAYRQNGLVTYNRSNHIHIEDYRCFSLNGSGIALGAGMKSRTDYPSIKSPDTFGYSRQMSVANVKMVNCGTAPNTPGSPCGAEGAPSWLIDSVWAGTGDDDDANLGSGSNEIKIYNMELIFNHGIGLHLRHDKPNNSLHVVSIFGGQIHGMNTDVISTATKNADLILLEGKVKNFRCFGLSWAARNGGTGAGFHTKGVDMSLHGGSGFYIPTDIQVFGGYTTQEVGVWLEDCTGGMQFSLDRDAAATADIKVGYGALGNAKGDIQLSFIGGNTKSNNASTLKSDIDPACTANVYSATFLANNDWLNNSMAKGDGSTDDRVAILAANAKCAALGIPLVFPEGSTYAASGLLTATTSWIGGGTIKRIGSGTLTQSFITAGANSLAFDIKVDGNSRTVTAGAEFLISSRNYIRTLPGFEVKNSYWRGVTCQNSNYCSLRGKVSNVTDIGVLIAAQTQNVYGLSVDMTVDKSMMDYATELAAGRTLRACMAVNGTSNSPSLAESDLTYAVTDAQVRALCMQKEDASLPAPGLSSGVQCFTGSGGVVGGNFDITAIGGNQNIAMSNTWNVNLRGVGTGSNHDGLEWGRGGGPGCNINFNCGPGRSGIMPACAVRLEHTYGVKVTGSWRTTNVVDDGYPIWLLNVHDCDVSGILSHVAGLRFMRLDAAKKSRIAVRCSSPGAVTRAIEIDTTVDTVNGYALGGANSCDGLVLDGCTFDPTTNGIKVTGADAINDFKLVNGTEFNNTGAFKDGALACNMVVSEPRGAAKTITVDTVLARYDNLIRNNKPAATCALTLLDATKYPPTKRVKVINLQAQTVVSASANVVPLAGGAAGTAMLPAVVGSVGEFETDGALWLQVV